MKINIMEEETQKSNKGKDRLVTSTLLFGPIVIMLLFIGVQAISFPEGKQQLAQTTTATPEQEPKEDEIHIAERKVYKKIPLIANAAIVKNLRTGEVLYAKNLTDRLPLASLTKLMTAVTVTENLSEEAIVEVTDRDIATEGSDTLNEGEKWNLNNLRDFMLVGSSNDSASALASVAGIAIQDNSPNSKSKSVFIAEMNQVARNIGLKNSHFYNESGLDLKGRAGAFGSVEDVATLLDYIVENHPNILEATKEESIFVTSIDGFQHTVFNTNKIVGQLPNIIGSKTGFTEEAGGNLAVVVDAGLNDPVALVVLGSTFDGRFEDIQALANEFVTMDLRDN